MNNSNSSKEHVGLRKSLLEFSKQHYDISETINTTEKPTFFRVLKNNLECAFCKKKDCPARYSHDKTGMSLRYSGQYYPIGCQKKRRKR